MCSKEKATFGPIFDQVLQALINTLGPQWIPGRQLQGLVPHLRRSEDRPCQVLSGGYNSAYLSN